MDFLDDLPLGVEAPWEYNDNMDMKDASGEEERRCPVPPPIEFPPHWGELMEQIRVREEELKRVMLSRRSGGESVSTKPVMPPEMPMPSDPHAYRMVPPSGYSLLIPPEVQGGVFQPPYVPYPHMPFWTAAPLPFSPGLYPVNVLPPTARESLLTPKAPPRPVESEESKKKKNGRRSTSKSRKKTPARPRDANGMFVPTKSEADNTNLLMGRIRELQNQLLRSQYESVILREQLVHSQMELVQLKDRGLVQANLRGGYQAQPNEPASTSVRSGSPPSSSNMPAHLQKMDKLDTEAFRVHLDYNELKSKLRPTGTTSPDGFVFHPESLEQ